MDNSVNEKANLIIGLQKKGYDVDFILKDEYLLCLQERDLLGPEDFEIIETYQFKESQDDSETYVVYAIRSVHRDLKGILMTSYTAFFLGIGIHLWCKLSATLKSV
jgi:hypothetical protein